MRRQISSRQLYSFTPTAPVAPDSMTSGSHLLSLSDLYGSLNLSHAEPHNVYPPYSSIEQLQHFNCNKDVDAIASILSHILASKPLNSLQTKSIGLFLHHLTQGRSYYSLTKDLNAQVPHPSYALMTEIEASCQKGFQFGIEQEWMIPMSNHISKPKEFIENLYKKGIYFNASNYGMDPSITPPQFDQTGKYIADMYDTFESQSIIINNIEKLNTFMHAMQIIAACGAEVNNSTGQHIHIGIDHYSIEHFIDHVADDVKNWLINLPIFENHQINDL